MAGRIKKENVRDQNGDIVNGLSKLPTDPEDTKAKKIDRRYRVIATNRKFSAPDDETAIRKFRQLIGGRDAQVEAEIKAALGPLWGSSDPSKQGLANADDVTKGKWFGFNSVSNAPIEYIFQQRGNELWAYFAKEISTRPQWVAQQTGDERIGYLPTKKLSPAPTLTALEETYFGNLEISKPERLKVRKYWRDFISVTGIKDIREITDEVGIKYKNAVKARQWGTKTRRKAYSAVKRVLTYAVENAVGTKDCQNALNELAVMKESRKERGKFKSKAISKDDFHKLLKTAQGDNKAMILLMANCALYVQEVCRVRWDEIVDGVFISRRSKTDNPIRVAGLWPETLAALATIKRRGEYVFYGETGLPITVSGMGKRFTKLRNDAGLPKTVTGSHLRDSASQSMADAGIDRKARKIVMGHIAGMEDFYEARKAVQTAGATEAIRAAYFPPQEP